MICSDFLISVLPETVIPLIAIFSPVICSVLIVMFKNHPNLREGWTIITSVICCVSILSLIPFILKDGTISLSLFTIFPGIDYAYHVDAFGLIFALTSSLLWIIVSFYSIGYMRSLNEHNQTRFYFFFALAMFSTIGVAFSRNLVTMYIHYELLSLFTYPLVAHEETREALSAGRKYLVYMITSGCFLLAATLVTYWLTGTTDFTYSGIITINSASKIVLQSLFVIFILGFMKAAYMPFHSWLPTAMVAPTPVSALLHAVAVVKAGVFGIIRVVCYIYGINLIQELGLGVILACFISFTVIVANLFAIREDNLKKRLAYSTINQLAFIILGASLLSPLSLKGSMIHIFFHAFMKITLFMCAGTITAITGMKYISEMKGIGKALPITSISFIIGALGMCGLPPAAGFISKWFIGLGAIDSGYTIFLFVILIASLLDAVYFFPIIWTILFDELDKGNFDKIKTKIKDNKISVTLMVLPLLITAIASVLFFIFPDTLGVLNLADIAVNNLFCIYGG